MAAPDFVPTDPTQKLRTYSSPPLRPGGWKAGRPGEIDGSQPKGRALGTTGPDQGYAYKLVRHVEDRLHLGEVKRDDAVAGGVALAMKRSALLGRAPVIHDLLAAFTVYGFLDPNPPSELQALRRETFAEISSHHHYLERRHVVDRVPEEMLRRSPAELMQLYRSDWTKLVGLDPESAADAGELP
ncbi:MAG: hypothetical protein OER95_05265 [Acidimicrobiia bacterium]|nr:hypothetical protein [Acidimicrobiia bacterium]